MRRYATISVLIVVVLLCCVLFLVYLGPRLDSIEDALRYREPQADGKRDTGTEDEFSNLAQGQTVYVPAYSHIYHQDGRPRLLTVTLSARNTDTNHEVVLTSVRYYDTHGKELKSLLEKPFRLGPLATAEFLIERSDTSGGSGANFLVEWVASELVTPPIFETVMIDTSGQQGISFARPGTVVKEHVGDPGAGGDAHSDPER